MRHVIMAFLLSAMPAFAQAASLDAERAFAELLLGRYFEDPCANTSQGAQSCRPEFTERRMTFTDHRASQTYRFEENRCIVHAETLVTKTGKRYSAVFNLQNVAYVNLNKSHQDGSIKEVEYLLQGNRVLRNSERSGNVLVFIHRYYADARGDMGHTIKDETRAMREGLKVYQDRYCGAEG